MDELLEFLRDLGIEPSRDLPQKLERFHRELAAANRRLNLTRITGFEDFLFKHVADSLLAVRAWPPLREQALAVADVGSGGGFPGLPLALALPHLRVTEIDSARKKSEAVAGFLEALGLAGSRSVARRARELAREPEFRGAFDLVVARAVAPAAELIRECRGLLKEERSAILSYKTPELARDEEELVLREAKKARLAARRSPVYALPGKRGHRCFWILERPG